MKIEQGKWYLLNYGFEQVKGLCVEVLDSGGIFKFYWGTPFRIKNFVPNDNIIQETQPASLFSNL